jgi:hypothetical protein
MNLRRNRKLERLEMDRHNERVMEEAVYSQITRTTVGMIDCKSGLQEHSQENKLWTDIYYNR